MENEIGQERWERHFRLLLDGKDVEEKEECREEDNEAWKGVEVREKEGAEEAKQEELKDEEIVTAINRMKKGKDAGMEGIPMEAWKYGGAAVRAEFKEIIKRVWRGGDLPLDWKTGIIVPIFKKGNQEMEENYRDIALLCTAYKIYAKIVRNRLEKEVNRLQIIPESQGGFRQGRGTVDNIFILQHIVHHERLRKDKDKKVFALFVDLKAAFDTVGRQQLWTMLKERGVEKERVKRLKKIYEDTRSVIRTKEGATGAFTTQKGVRHGCVLSPLLFNLCIANLDKVLAKRGIGGVKLGRKRVWSLTYADDMWCW